MGPLRCADNAGQLTISSTHVSFAGLRELGSLKWVPGLF